MDCGKDRQGNTENSSMEKVKSIRTREKGDKQDARNEFKGNIRNALTFLMDENMNLTRLKEEETIKLLE